MTAKEFLRDRLGDDLPESMGNKVAALMEEYHEYLKTKEENESKNNERS